MPIAKIRYALSFAWFLLGIGKVLAVLGEIIIGKELISPLMTNLFNHVSWNFYSTIGDKYYIPYALLFIFLAGLIEIVSAVLILKGEGWAKLGTVGVCLMIVLYLPFHQGIMFLGELLFLGFHVWFFTQDLNPDLLQEMGKKIFRK